MTLSSLQEVKRGAGHLWESVADGWRDLRERASGAITRFSPAKNGGAVASRDDDDDGLFGFGLPSNGWAFMAADVYDHDDRVVVRVEVPGMRREDLGITVDGETLIVSGDKRSERESRRGDVRLMQCAYGSFRRLVALPAPVQAENARASYRDGVLKIELPKAEGARRRRIAVAVR